MEKVNNTMIETPIVIQIEQLKYTITKAIEDSKLPIFIINPILKDFYMDSNTILQEYTKQEINKYQQANQESSTSEVVEAKENE
jgi:hypothetical protein